MIKPPLAIDLFCGLGGWTEGLLAEDYDVVGFDIERHHYGDHRYPAQLVIQDILTLNGSQFKAATLIVASPPCQEYSYMAMPWKVAKAKAAAIRADATGQKLADLNRLFDACFRIQKEASFAAGHHIPMIVENVRGAQPWVGRARWNFGSFYLWGDVPALMPITLNASKVPGHRFGGNSEAPSASFQSASVEQTGFKTTGMNWNDRTKTGQDFTRTAGRQALGRDPMFERGFTQTAADRLDGRKNTGGSWFNVAHNTTSGKGQNPDGRKRNDPRYADGLKQPGISGPRANGNGDRWFQDGAAQHGSKSPSRKMASAMIAKIPLPLSRHIASTFKATR